MTNRSIVCISQQNKKGAVPVALLLRDVYEDTRQRFQLQLLAGEQGLQNCMRWVYVSEDYTTSDFLYGGELILTTGVLSGKSEGWLLHLLHSIFRQHACGLIVNEGPYLDRRKIPQAVLDFCNTQNFPLFVMPWHIHIYDITRDYCDRIFTDARHNEAIERAFLTLLDRKAAPGPALRLLADQGFAQQGPYYVVQLQISPETPTDPVLRDWISAFLLPFSAFAMLDTPNPWLVCQADDADKVQELVENLQTGLQTRFPNRTVAAGIGGQVPELNRLANSLKQAQAALRWGKSQALNRASYDDMGFFRLLLEIPSHAFLENYVREQLGAVLDYDTQHGSDLAQTLYLYLVYQGSIQSIAAQSFFHRNTISHRIAILRDKLGYRLDAPAACFQLLTAFQIRDFLHTCAQPFT